jgi:hypothetical protein
MSRFGSYLVGIASVAGALMPSASATLAERRPRSSLRRLNPDIETGS